MDNPIKIEHDYDLALIEVEALWGAEVGSPEGDKLNIMISLVEKYEAKHYPIDPPISRIRE